jgi:hypothetical protein
MDFSTPERDTIRAALTHRLPSHGDSPFRDVMATDKARELTMGAIGARLLVVLLRQWQRAMRTATKEEKAEAVLAGAAVDDEAIAALIERIEREGQP